MPGSPIIQLQDVHLTLKSGAGRVHILRGVCAEIMAGEAVGIVGPSGSGKSTIMSVIAGLEKPTGGAVYVDGTDLAMLSEDELARFRRRRVGIVFQSFHLIPTMTAYENIVVPLELAEFSDPLPRADAELEAVGLTARGGHYPSQLSGGEQQRIALARALAPEPKLLLADEPTGNLDGATGDAVIDLLFSLHRSRGMTLVLITHDPQLAARCSRVLHVRDGVIVKESAGETVASALLDHDR